MVYVDFLFNQFQFSAFTLGGKPTSTLNEWLMAKRQSCQTEYITGNSNPFAIANRFGLVNEALKISLVPQSEFTTASAEINGNLVSDFGQIPAITVGKNTNISIKSGKFNLIVYAKDSIQMIEMEPNSLIETGENNAIKLLNGNLDFKAPISFQTSLAKVIPKSSNFQIKLEPELTTFIVFEGEVKISSDSDEDIIKTGQSTIMNKKGKIKKTKTMKYPPVQTLLKEVENPFRTFK